MKKFFLATILIAGLSALAQTFFPWWSMAIVAFIIGFLIPQKREAAWFTGVVAIFALWLVFAIVPSKGNNGLLAARLAELFHPLTGGKIWRLYFMVGAIGGFVAAFSSLSVRLTRPAFLPPQV